MKYYLKEEFLHDNDVKNAGNKARNDVEEIVKLRNDISHFNDYKITQNDLERYIDYLELLLNYVLLRLVRYGDESFLNNIRFYPNKYRVFHFEND